METHLGGRRRKQSRWPMNNHAPGLLRGLFKKFWTLEDEKARKSPFHVYSLKSRLMHSLTAHRGKLITFVKHFIFWQESSNLAEGYSPFFVSKDLHVQFLLILTLFLAEFECVAKKKKKKRAWKHKILFYPATRKEEWLWPVSFEMITSTVDKRNIQGKGSPLPGLWSCARGPGGGGGK